MLDVNTTFIFINPLYANFKVPRHTLISSTCIFFLWILRRKCSTDFFQMPPDSNRVRNYDSMSYYRNSKEKKDKKAISLCQRTSEVKNFLCCKRRIIKKRKINKENRMKIKIASKNTHAVMKMNKHCFK